MAGHGGDVKTCDWHPSNSVVASGAKDAVVKLWDARAGREAIATLHGHKATITQVGSMAQVPSNPRIFALCPRLLWMLKLGDAIHIEHV
jgi:polyadenylation factor subunit 2